MQSIALVSDDISSQWTLNRTGGGKVMCESVRSTSVVRVDLSDAAPLPEGFGLLSDLVAELAANPEISDERRVFAREQRERGVLTLATLRMERGLSQLDLANHMGTSQAAISRLESGAQEPLLSTMRKLAVALNVDLNTLNGAFLDG